MSSLHRENVRAELDRLYQETLRTDPAIRERAKADGSGDDSHPDFYDAMRDAFMPVTPNFGRLLYLAARIARARTIVEFGSSFGISTIFLAAALRDNGGGRLVTTELHASKAARALAHLRNAGLADLVEMRVGDALETLRAVPAPVDLLFLDGPKAKYGDVLSLLEPKLREGALVASDNVDFQSARAYLERIESSGYVSVSLSTSALGTNHGHMLTMKP